MKDRLYIYMHNPRLIFQYILLNCKIAQKLSDELYLKWFYRINTGQKLLLDEPKTFTEKLQYLKIYDRKKEYSMMVDKYEVRKYIAKNVGVEYLIPLIGVWDKFEDIDFNKLPMQFVLKCTHGSHCSEICIDKRTLNIRSLKQKFNKWLNQNWFWQYREYPYKNVKPRIIAEELMQNNDGSKIIDYKFYCFAGDVMYCQVMGNEINKETIDFYDTEWNHKNIIGLKQNVTNALHPHARPKKYFEMIKIAKQLSARKPFVRIDLYDIDNKIFFGEITFYPNAGLGSLRPKKWNTIFGSWIELSNIKY